MTSTSIAKHTCETLIAETPPPTAPMPGKLSAATKPLDSWRTLAATEHSVVPEAVLELDALARRLSAVDRRLVLPLAAAAAALQSCRGWSRYGFRNLEEFALEQLDRTGRWVRDLAALHVAVRRHASLSRALCGTDGGPPLKRNAALAIGRIATPETIQSWIDKARTCTLEQLKEEIRRQVDTSPSDRSQVDPSHGDPLQAAPATRAYGDSSRAVAAADALEPPTFLIKMPAAVQARLASEEVLELYRAVTGREASFSDFLESLAAEGASGSFPFDVEHRPLGRRAPETPPPPSNSARDRPPAAWSRFPGHTAAARRAVRDMEELVRVLGRLETMQKPSGGEQTGPPDRNPPRARDACRLLEELIRFESRVAMRIGDLLAELQDRWAWRSLGFAGLEQYASERLGMSPSACRERVVLARGLRRLAVVRSAYEEGKLGLAAALRILRLARRAAPDLRDVPEASQRTWLERAQEDTVRRLDDDARIARQKIERERLLRGWHAVHMPAPADDEEWFRSLLRVPGQARERVYELGHEILERAKCSWVTAEVVMAFRLREEVAEQFLGSVESARRRLEDWAGAGESLTAGEEARLAPSWRIARLLAERLASRNFSSAATPADGLMGSPGTIPDPNRSRRCRLPAWVGFLALLEEFVEVWDDPRGIPRRHADAVYESFGYRCIAPGCRARRNLEDHHIVYRSHLSPHQGGQALTNRLCACRFHHQLGEHGGLAQVRGTAPLDLVWRLGTPELGVWYRNDRRVPGP